MMARVAQGEHRTDNNPTGDPTGDEVLRALREVISATGLARTTMARRLGMSAHDVATLEMLMLSPDPLGPADLARRLGVTGAATTQAVHRLIAAGHITAEDHPQDRRRRILSVTAAGRAHVRSRLDDLLTHLRGPGETLTAAERHTVRSYLGAITTAYHDYLDTPQPDDHRP